jgi:hypothetical protein
MAKAIETIKPNIHFNLTFINHLLEVVGKKPFQPWAKGMKLRAQAPSPFHAISDTHLCGTVPSVHITHELEQALCHFQMDYSL